MRSFHSLGLLFLALGWSNAQHAGRYQVRENACIALGNCPGLEDPSATTEAAAETPTTTAAQVADSSSAAASPAVTETGPFCVPFQNPHNGPKGESYCTCNNQQAYSMYCDGKCPWTTDPPSVYLVPTAGPTPAPSDCMRTDLPTEGPPPGVTNFGTSTDAASATPTETSPPGSASDEPSSTPAGASSTSSNDNPPASGTSGTDTPSSGASSSESSKEGPSSTPAGDPSNTSSDSPPNTSSDGPSGSSTAAAPGSTTPSPPDSTTPPDQSTSAGEPATTNAPAPSATSTVTEPPPGFSTATETNSAWTSNTEVSTTGPDGQPTTVPVLVGCKECGGDHSGIVLWGLITGGGGSTGGGGGGGTLFQLPGLPSFTIGGGGGGGGGGGSTPNTQNQPENPRESDSPSQSNNQQSSQENTSQQSNSDQQTSNTEQTSTGQTSTDGSTASQTGSQTGSQTATETGSQTDSQTSEPTATECPTKRSVRRRYVPGRGPITFIEFDAAKDIRKRETTSQAADPLAQALKMIGQGEDIESSATKLIRNKFEPKEWKLTDTQKIQLQNAFVTGLEGEFTGTRQFNGQTYKGGMNWKVRWDWEPIDNPNAVDGVSKGVHVNLQVDDLQKKIASQRFGISFTGQPRDPGFYYDVIQKQGADLEWDWKIKDYTGINALPEDRREQARKDEEAQAVKKLAQNYRAARERLPANC